MLSPVVGGSRAFLVVMAATSDLTVVVVDDRYLFIEMVKFSYPTFKGFEDDLSVFQKSAFSSCDIYTIGNGTGWL